MTRGGREHEDLHCGRGTTRKDTALAYSGDRRKYLAKCFLITRADQIRKQSIIYRLDIRVGLRAAYLNLLLVARSEWHSILYRPQGNASVS